MRDYEIQVHLKISGDKVTTGCFFFQSYKLANALTEINILLTNFKAVFFFLYKVIYIILAYIILAYIYEPTHSKYILW